MCYCDWPSISTNRFSLNSEPQNRPIQESNLYVESHREIAFCLLRRFSLDGFLSVDKSLSSLGDFTCTLPVSSLGKMVAGQLTVLKFCALLLSSIFSLLYFPSLFLFYILRNFVKMIAVLLILDKCNLYILQNTKFVKTMDMKIQQYDTTPIERCNFRSLYGETSCFSI